MGKCRSCLSDIEPFVDFGRMPLANGFLTPNQFTNEYFFNLSAAFCPRCTLVQLVEQPPRERMFNERYPFFSGSSARMQAHFAALAMEVIALMPGPDPLVVEIGSNDGTLLRHFALRNIRHIGIEPSRSVAGAAAANGVLTLSEFFDAPVAATIVAEHGQAAAVIATNALSHIPDPHSTLAAIDRVLAPNGRCIFEEPYWERIVAQTAFDQIYDEHACYFSATSLQHLMEPHGLTLLDVAAIDVHGGSLRYTVGRRGSAPPSHAVGAWLEHERASRLHHPETFAAFRSRVLEHGRSLIDCLDQHHSRGARIVGYGATSKSTTTINFLGIGPDRIEFVCDTTPAKWATFTPGAHIPVRPHEQFAERYPDYALLFSWNHAEEIRAKEHAFAAAGGRWISYVPAVREF